MYLRYVHFCEFESSWNDIYQTVKQLKGTRHKVKAVNKKIIIIKKRENTCAHTHIRTHTHTHTHTHTPA